MVTSPAPVASAATRRASAIGGQSVAQRWYSGLAQL